MILDYMNRAGKILAIDIYDSTVQFRLNICGKCLFYALTTTPFGALHRVSPESNLVVFPILASFNEEFILELLKENLVKESL